MWGNWSEISSWSIFICNHNVEKSRETNLTKNESLLLNVSSCSEYEFCWVLSGGCYNQSQSRRWKTVSAESSQKNRNHCLIRNIQLQFRLLWKDFRRKLVTHSPVSLGIADISCNMSEESMIHHKTGNLCPWRNLKVTGWSSFRQEWEICLILSLDRGCNKWPSEALIIIFLMEKVTIF